MLRKEIDEEDLRNEIFNLRKHIARVCSENQILKVKIRKLQDEMIKRDKQLDEFLRSKRYFGVTKNLQDKEASVLLNLKLKNDKLEKILLEKDLTIKRLQNTLQTAKLYNANSVNRKFTSKGTECSLIADKKLEFHKKGKLNTKIELHLPNFDGDRFKEHEESADIEKEMAMNRRNANTVESQFLLDINFDLKQRTKPYYSEARYESRRASYQMEAKESKSDGTLGNPKTPRGNAPSETRGTDDDFRARAQYQLQENHCGEGSLMNPTFKKILQTVEELMSRGSAGINIYNRMSIDQSVQFPTEAFPEIFELASTISADQNPDDARSSPLTQIEIEEQQSGKDMVMLENELPPALITEMQVQDLTEFESVSISEKTDKMEKTESQDTKKSSDHEMPHEEIKQLHVFLMDMISQVDNLKDTISQMKADQEKTESDLKSKDESIVKLAREIEELREFKSVSSASIDRYCNIPRSNIEPAEKDTGPSSAYETMQKATEANIRKIAGKIKHLKGSRSVSSQSDKKSSRASSKHKSEKVKTTEKASQKKTEKKSQKSSEQKRVLGIGNGDIIEIPYYRNVHTPCTPESFPRNEFDELD